ncbi:hypothetical protein RHMOL_Rhmol11G0001800 [Rhododendron molle]|uniref:Uncharacterized protein n=1 Tax=Rhododendron molle TaxID=49168 RepID=A0ACC0LME5_RHOML|nr:hypothetical protein RHMOL_Rhmol11G0001800 [Rhododendron molle]
MSLCWCSRRRFAPTLSHCGEGCLEFSWAGSWPDCTQFLASPDRLGSFVGGDVGRADSFDERAFFKSISVKEAPGRVGWYYFTERPGEGELVTELPTVNKNWKDKFFFVSGGGWELPDWEVGTYTPQIPSRWGVPITNYEESEDKGMAPKMDKAHL